MIVHIAVPAMNEADFIGQTLTCIKNQNCNSTIKVYVCVNQPESYWNHLETDSICADNQLTLNILQDANIQNLTIIDRCSKGLGWDSKKFGVGMARKVLMDYISDKAAPDDVVISLDSDTLFEPNYVQSIVNQFENYPKAVAISAPYYHKLTGKVAEDRAILRYEIYMRNYAIQMLLIDSPFAFTALGSALAFRISAYRAIGGMSPMKSGEDFYFLQQLRKYGSIVISNAQKVFPAARFSNRVFFGTGPAMIKGNTGDWNSYPIYQHSLFMEVEWVYHRISEMYDNDIAADSVFYQFLQTQFKEQNFLNPLRKNAKSRDQFIRAFHTKVDGLRVLQFLKFHQVELNDRKLILQNYPEFKDICNQYPESVSMVDFTVSHLAEIRDRLTQIENQLITEKKILL